MKPKKDLYITNRSANDWLEVKKDIKKASAILSLLIELFPTKVDEFLNLEDAYYSTKKYNKAKKYFNSAIPLDPLNDIAKKMLATIENL